MEKIIIEVISDHKHQGDYKIFEGGCVHIGRSLENDLILNDPFVSEKHLVIRLEEGLLRIQDFQSRNGTYVPRTKRFEPELVIGSGEELIVGRTRIRVYLESHQVQPAKLLDENKTIFRWMHLKPVAWGLLVVLMVVSYIEAHLLTVENETIQKLLSAPIMSSTIILIWAGFWALLGRLLCHRINFTVHISICCLWILIHDIFERANDYLCFYLNNQLLHLIINYIIYTGMFIIALSFSLIYATNMTKKSRIVFSAVFTLIMLISITGMRLSVSDDYAEYYLTDLPYDATLKPPVFGPPNSFSIDQFVKKSDVLYERVGKKKRIGSK
ncbi:MAG: FHA domain-containing protein [Candidatus Omnitrophota bacterium]